MPRCVVKVRNGPKPCEEGESNLRACMAERTVFLQSLHAGVTFLLKSIVTLLNGTKANEEDQSNLRTCTGWTDSIFTKSTRRATYLPAYGTSMLWGCKPTWTLKSNIYKIEGKVRGAFLKAIAGQRFGVHDRSIALILQPFMRYSTSPSSHTPSTAERRHSSNHGVFYQTNSDPLRCFSRSQLWVCSFC